MGTACYIKGTALPVRKDEGFDLKDRTTGPKTAPSATSLRYVQTRWLSSAAMRFYNDFNVMVERYEEPQ